MSDCLQNLFCKRLRKLDLLTLLGYSQLIPNLLFLLLQQTSDQVSCLILCRFLELSVQLYDFKLELRAVPFTALELLGESVSIQVILLSQRGVLALVLIFCIFPKLSRISQCLFEVGNSLLGEGLGFDILSLHI